MRKTQFAEGEFYHIFNRGVDKRIVFNNQRDLNRFFQSMVLFNTEEPIGSIYEHTYIKNTFGSSTSKKIKGRRLVNIVCYCLNPNHYHFILQPSIEKGIEKFMHRLSTGYTKYFNAKYKRSGVLFQGRYKSIHIDSNEQLLHTSVYVNLNFKGHCFGSSTSKTEEKMYLSSWDEYNGKSKFNFCKKDDILGQFKNRKEYKRFAEQALPGILERKETLKEMEE